MLHKVNISGKRQHMFSRLIQIFFIH